MKNNSIGVVAVAVLAGIPLLFQARSAGAGGTCSNATLHGSYAYSADGFVTQMPNQGPYTPIAETGTYTFDGLGTFSTTNTISVGGQIFPRTATGTYAVNGDCTGSANIVGGVTFNFAIVRAAQSFRFVVSTQGVVVTGTMERQ